MAELVLALDLSTHTGWAIGRLGGNALEFGTMHLPKTGDDLGRFLFEFEVWLRDLIQDRHPDKVFFEAPIMSQRTMTARKLMSLAGVTEKVCFELRVPYEEAVLSSVKLFFAGHGKAEKKHMIDAARRMHGWPVEDDNQADACGIWLYGCACINPELRRLAAPKLNLPPKPRKLKGKRK